MHLVIMVNHHFVIGRSFLTELSNILNNTANDTIVELLQRYNADQLQIPEEELWVVEAPIMPEPEPGTHFIMIIFFFFGGGGGGGGDKNDPECIHLSDLLSHNILPFGSSHENADPSQKKSLDFWLVWEG